MKRRCLVFVLMMALLAPVADAGPHARAQSSDPPLDLAAMVLFPADLDDAGHPGFVTDSIQPDGYGDFAVIDSAFRSLRQDEASDEIRNTFDDADWQRVYAFDSVVQEDPMVYGSPVQSFVRMVITEFGDEGGAAGVFDYLTDDALFTDDSVAVDLDGNEPGDAAVLRFVEVTDSDVRDEYIRFNLILLAGNLLVDVSLDGPPDAFPEGDGGAEDVADVLGLGERIVDKVETVRAGDGPGLGELPVRITPGDDGAFPVEDSNSYYRAVDGVPIRSFLMTDEAFDDLVADYEDRDIVSAFARNQHLTNEDGISVFVNVNVRRYGSEDAAEPAIDETLDDYSGFDGFEIVDGAPSLGDESIVVSFDRTTSDGIVIPAHLAAVRVGTDRFTITVSPEIEAITAHAVIALAEAQVACVETETCHEPIDFPDELIGDAAPAEERASDETSAAGDVAQETPEASDEADASDATDEPEAGQYESPLHGYTLGSRCGIPERAAVEAAWLDSASLPPTGIARRLHAISVDD